MSRPESHRFLVNCTRTASAVFLTLASGLALTLGVQAASAQTSFNVIYDFTGGPDGGYPAAGVTMDKAGNLYGTTYLGGIYYQGAVFKLTRRNSSWIVTPLHDFQGGTGDGQLPESRVLVGPDGRLYGTTPYGGSSLCSRGCGIIYSLTPPATTCPSASCQWSETVIHRFSGVDGANPGTGDLIFDQAGNIYGTTTCGGTHDLGVVYKLTPSNGGWTESVLYSFTGQNGDGAAPYAGVIFDNAGNLYGTTIAGGGPASYGTIYRLSPSGSGWTENVLHSFNPQQDGADPQAGLIMDQSGNCYGATSGGGPAGGGTAFELMPSGEGWSFDVLYAFAKTSSGAPGPTANLLLLQGNLYGTLQGWVDGNDPGSVFELTQSNGSWTEEVLHHFTAGDDGGQPRSNLVMDAAGNLYGTTFFFGANGVGVIFELSP